VGVIVGGGMHYAWVTGSDGQRDGGAGGRREQGKRVKRGEVPILFLGQHIVECEF